MKIWLYTVWSVVILASAYIIFFITGRDTEGESFTKLKNEMELKKMRMHQNKASWAKKKAHIHIEKARNIAQKSNVKSRDINDAIPAWNDEEI